MLGVHGHASDVGLWKHALFNKPFLYKTGIDSIYRFREANCL